MVRKVVLAGTPYERGTIYGETFKHQIAQIIQEEVRTLKTQIETRGFGSLSDQEYYDLAEKGARCAKEYASDLYAELEGIAKSANVGFEDIVFFNYFLDFFDLSYAETRTNLLPVGCTCFAAAGPATDNGHVYIGQNYDWCTTTHPVTLIETQSKNTPKILCLTIPGLLGCAGMNSAGIGIVINKLLPIDNRMGVPYTFVLRKALEQSSICRAIDVILNAPRSSGISYLIADKSGEILCLETTATDIEVLFALDNYIGHTNHYIHPRLAIHDASIKSGREGDTYVRWSRITKLLKQQIGQINLDFLKQCARDHVGYPASICQHPGTLASVIMDLQTLHFWIAEKNPCQSEYEQFEIALE